MSIMSEEQDRLLARIQESKSDLAKALVTGNKERIKEVRGLHLKS